MLGGECLVTSGPDQQGKLVSDDEDQQYELIVQHSEWFKCALAQGTFLTETCQHTCRQALAVLLPYDAQPPGQGINTASASQHRLFANNCRQPGATQVYKTGQSWQITRHQPHTSYATSCDSMLSNASHMCCDARATCAAVQRSLLGLTGTCPLRHNMPWSHIAAGSLP